MVNTRYTIEQYDKKDTFSGFLPGIAGIHGIPLWCYYVNRGQAVASFGVKDKDHAIMEFFPAQQAYRYTAKSGFRTFVRCNGVYRELFAEESDTRKMHVDMNMLSLEDWNKELQLHTGIMYFIMPGENTGMLVRRLVIRNEGKCSCALEVLDGMPVVIPYGINMGSVKNMGETSKAWMQTEDIDERVPYFRVRASMEDTACVTAVEGGNFAAAFDEKGGRLPVLADPSRVFGFDVSLSEAVCFREKSIKDLLQEEQVTTNQYPCCFFAAERTLGTGESLTVWETIGQVDHKDRLRDYFASTKDNAYFEAKKEEARDLTRQLCRVIKTKTASPAFDIYSAYTYMDNVLRGGYPIQLGEGKIFHIYSRKHGDLERDYNYFSMLPEFYSQGNGNFRDVNQNRRCEPFFSPYVGEANIRRFYNLIQLDGYNPLSVEKTTYTIEKEKAEEIFAFAGEKQKKIIVDFLGSPFTPGQFFDKLYGLGCKGIEEIECCFHKVMEQAKSAINAEFGEGYWSDHWTYNLDLVETYLMIFPENEERLLYSTDLAWYRQQAFILPRRKRYAKTKNGLRQYYFLSKGKERACHSGYVQDRTGKILKASLMEKLIVLCAVKYAALDAYGMGLEMEGGKPGWYDALNGMPGVFGSSMAETYELDRLLNFTIMALERYGHSVQLLAECAQLLREMGDITATCIEEILSRPKQLSFWKKRNDAKERYWAQIAAGTDGTREELQAEEILAILVQLRTAAEEGIRKANAMEDGVCPTYFTYEVVAFSEDEDGIYPEDFEVKRVPLFLEGAARYLKLPMSQEEKRKLYHKVRQSELYDKELHMYKVNASLQEASFELGRAKSFTPGWLENESIWLHMEYKYLLELLKSGMYKEYAADFEKTAIPFLNPERYGRCIYENSSFIASSSNPNKDLHGRGFVARLSGAAAEFLQMWILMMFGRPFSIEEGELRLSFRPALPSYLVGEARQVEAAFMGNTKVTYYFKQQRDYFPGEYQVTQMELLYPGGKIYKIMDDCLKGTAAEDVRAGRVEEIKVTVN